MEKVRRVRDIARELGVSSQAIIEKCKREQIEGIETEFSPVKIGMELTIVEWFSNRRDVD